MQSSRFSIISTRITPFNIRTHFRKLSASSLASSVRSSISQRNSFASRESSPTASSIHSILLRQSSLLDMEEEHRSFGPELDMLEPRPVVFFGSVEERLGW